MPEIITPLTALAPGDTHTADEDGAYVITGRHTHADILRYVVGDIGVSDATALLMQIEGGEQ